MERDRFGGTCLNRGCIPSKMLVHTADVADTVRDAGRFGVQAHLDGVDWPTVRDRIWTRLDPLPATASRYRAGKGVTVFHAPARFTGLKTLAVGDETITADRFVLAAGARTIVPDLPGLDDVAYETSDTIMRRETQPARLVILGGGFVAAELGHVFGALGSDGDDLRQRRPARAPRGPRRRVRVHQPRPRLGDARARRDRRAGGAAR